MKKDFEADKQDQKAKAEEHQEIVRKTSVEKKKPKADSKAGKEAATPRSTKNSDEEDLADTESTSNETKDGRVKEVGPTFVERVKTSIGVRYQDAKTAVYNRMPSWPTFTRPTLPSLASVREGISNRMPSMPQIHLPSISEYLPDMPSMPKIPLPEPLDSAVSSLATLDEQHVSPLIQRLNYLILAFSISSMLFSAVNELLIFKPVNIINLTSEALRNETEATSFTVPFVWTLSTSSFVETNFFYLLLHLTLINYIVIKNKAALEHIWRRRDFFYMVLVAGFLATTTHFAWRLALFALFKNEEAYREFEYGSINLITMALVLGLRQVASHQTMLQRQTQQVSAITFTNPSIKTEFDSGIPFISGNIILPYQLLP